MDSEIITLAANGLQPESGSSSEESVSPSFSLNLGLMVANDRIRQDAVRPIRLRPFQGRMTRPLVFTI